MKKNGLVFSKRFGFIGLALMLLLISYGLAMSATVEEFYKGKTMTFLVPNSPGGGYDTWARMLSPYIGKVIGCPVIVVNKSGASGLVGANYMYTEAKPDGLTIAINQPFTVLTDEFFGNRAVKYDSKKFKWLARASYDDYAVTVSRVTPYRSLDAIKKAKVFKLGVDSRTATNGAGVTAFCLAANLENARMIVGYAGSSEVRLAMLKGEVDCTSGSVGTQVTLIKSGDFIPITIIGNHRSKDLPDVPTVYELIPNIQAENKKWVDLIVRLSGLGRALITAPGVPEDKVNFLSGVVKKALAYPDFIKRAEAGGFTVNYLSGPDYMKDLQAVRLTPEEGAKFKFILEEKYPG